VTKPANLGDKVVWGGFALLCAGYAAWNTRILLGVLGLGRGKGADA
jgi:hypothetical protein